MFELKKCVEKAREKGIFITRSELAKLLWPDSPQQSRLQLLTQLMSGKVKVRPEWVPKLCEVLECTSDELFGISDFENK